MKRAVAALVVGAWWVGVSTANPVFVPDHPSTRPLVPVRAVPVDVQQETMSVAIGPGTRRETIAGSVVASPWYSASVTLRYRLKADKALSVPVVLPYLVEANDVRCRLNGQDVEVRQVSPEAMLRPYADTWRRTVERVIAGDEHLRGAVARIRALIAAAPRDQDADRASISQVELRLWTGSYAGSWLRQCSGVSAEWLLTSYLAGESMREAAGWRAGPVHDLGILRRLAIALDPQSPDPLALVDGAIGMLDPTTSYAVARLDLRGGINELAVSFTQTLGFDFLRLPQPAANRDEQRPGLSAAATVPAFRQCVGTARLWRGYGTRETVVRLPRGTQRVDCSEPAAKVDLGGDTPTVRWSGTGPPVRDIQVLFAVRELEHSSSLMTYGNNPPADPQAPPVHPRQRWSTLVATPGQVDPVNVKISVDHGRVLVCARRSATIHDVADGRVLHTFALPRGADTVLLRGDRVLLSSRPDDAGTQADTERGPRQTLYCLDLKGAVLWQTDLPAVAWTMPRLAVTGDTLLAWRCGRLEALGLADGRERWHTEANALDVVTASDAPALGLVYVVEGAEQAWANRSLTIAALALADGQPRWTWHGEGVYARLRLQPGDGLLAVVARAHDTLPSRFVALNPATGAVTWDRELPVVADSLDSHDAVLVYRPPTLLYATETTLTVTTYDPDGKPGRTERAAFDAQLAGPAACSGKRLYVAHNGGLQCLDPTTGRTLWRSDYPAICGVVVDDGRLVCQDCAGTVTVFDEPGPGELPPLDRELPRFGAVPADLAEVLAPRKTLAPR